MPESSRPLTAHEVKQLEPVAATEPLPTDISTMLGTFFVSSDVDKKPEVTSQVTPVEESLLPEKNDDLLTYRIDVKVTRHNFYVKRLLPNIPIKLFKYEDFTVHHLDPITGGYRPAFLDLNYVPRHHKGPSTRRRHMVNSKGKIVSNIFPPDHRYIFNDTSFPWCTVGRVTTDVGSGTGVMIGPRHLLTVSHVVVWNSDNTAGWLQFAPSYFNGNTPFGVANAQLTYFYQKNPDRLTNIQIAEDYVVCVLDQPLGNVTGWMGSRDYSEDWNNTGYWAHIGFSADLGGGVEPSYQSNVSFDDADPAIDLDPGDVLGEPVGTPGLDMQHHASITFGDSGGPFFGWWPQEPWPRVVGVQSAQDDKPQGPNWAGGGDPMVRLIQQARSEHP
jgi:V8-like Glu-specific endopeptidase